MEYEKGKKWKYKHVSSQTEVTEVVHTSCN